MKRRSKNDLKRNMHIHFVLCGSPYLIGKVDAVLKMLENISPLDLTLFSITVSLIAIGTLDNAQLNVVGNLLIGIGGLMIIAASQHDYLIGLDEAVRRDDMLTKQLDLLHKEIELISTRNSGRNKAK